MTHFNHSAASANRLKAAQEDAGIPSGRILCLKQMVDTRWNSEFDMLERLLTLRTFVGQALTKSKFQEVLTGLEWQIVEEVIDVLRPLSDATKISCAKKYPTISMVIPLVTGIKHQIKSKSRNYEPGSSAHILAKNLLDSLETRFHVFDSDIEPLTTFLDRRYRNFFREKGNYEKIKKSLLEEISHESSSPESSQSSEADSDRAKSKIIT